MVRIGKEQQPPRAEGPFKGQQKGHMSKKAMAASDLTNNKGVQVLKDVGNTFQRQGETSLRKGHSLKVGPIEPKTEAPNNRK